MQLHQGTGDPLKDPRRRMRIVTRDFITSRPREMTGRKIPYYTVDAFTDTPFRGNPAAVCLDIDDLSDSAMARIAAEMNLSETAFVYAPGVRPLRGRPPRSTRR